MSFGGPVSLLVMFGCVSWERPNEFNGFADFCGLGLCFSFGAVSSLRSFMGLEAIWRW